MAWILITAQIVLITVENEAPGGEFNNHPGNYYAFHYHTPFKSTTHSTTDFLLRILLRISYHAFYCAFYYYFPTRTAHSILSKNLLVHLHSLILKSSILPQTTALRRRGVKFFLVSTRILY